MQGRPADIELFDALYALMSAQGRGAALFGDAREAARRFFKRSLVLGSFPVLYFEFPLLGEPCLDLLSIYEHVPTKACFALGDGYGYQAVLDWFSGLDAAQRAAMGVELDLSQGVTEQAGIYFQQRGGLTLLGEFLQVIGQESRTNDYLRIQERMPRGWLPSYAGLFPAREGTPLRLGGYLSRPSCMRCSQDPAFLRSRFDRMGFADYTSLMLERCALLMGLVPYVDYQLDIGLDGLLGDTFGLSLSFGRCALHEVDECFSVGYGAKVMELLQGWGLADERWKLIPSMPFARGITYEDQDGRKRRLVMSVRLNYAKVKFVAGVAQAAKFYLAATAKEL